MTTNMSTFGEKLFLDSFSVNKIPIKDMPQTFNIPLIDAFLGEQVFRRKF